LVEIEGLSRCGVSEFRSPFELTGLGERVDVRLAVGASAHATSCSSRRPCIGSRGEVAMGLGRVLLSSERSVIDVPLVSRTKPNRR